MKINILKYLPSNYVHTICPETVKQPPFTVSRVEGLFYLFKITW